MKKVLVTGSEGFIGGYIVKELLNQNYEVYGIDNLTKYGQVIRNHSDDKNYKFFNEDIKNKEFLKEIMSECDYLIAGAAMIGGISYFHEFEYDLLSEDEKIISTTTDVAIDCYQNFNLKRAVYLSSSMVFESSDIFPTREDDLYKIPPPISSYGFQKLSVEYFARSAYSQYGLEFSIARPFNCVGIGEVKTKTEKKLTDSSAKLALSHVVPDLILKTLEGKPKIEILGSGNQIRHYTYGEDLAKGICLLLEHENAKNEDFNLSTSQSTTVLELAEIIWNKVRPEEKFQYQSVDSFEFDVQKRIPSTEKAKKLLGYEATTTIEDMLDVVIPWIINAKERSLF